MSFAVGAIDRQEGVRERLVKGTVADSSQRQCAQRQVTEEESDVTEELEGGY